jgi:hypothetical protein
MATTTEITNIADMLDLSAVYGDFSDDFDTDGVQNAYVEALQEAARVIAPSVTVHFNGMVIAEVTDADAARSINWLGLDNGIDITPILAAHQRA